MTSRTEPTCRTCYYLSLSEHQKERFVAEPQTTPAHYCPAHQKVQNDMYAALRGVRLQAAKKRPFPAIIGGK